MQGIYIARSGRYRVSICVNRKQLFQGTFDTYEEAEVAKIAAEREFRGEFTCGEIRPIPGLDGYFATSDGQVLGRHGRPVSFYIDKDGYKRVTAAVGRGKDAPRIHRGVHQAVCSAFHGPCPEGMVARHLDGSRANNIPDNLKWGTPLENSHDRHTHGTVPRGERSGNAKLKDDEAYGIRCFLAADFSEREVAEMFNISQRSAGNIKHRRTWAHVTRGSWQKN